MAPAAVLAAVVRRTWWVQVLLVHLAARGVSAAVLVAVASTQAANPWTEQSPSYLPYVGLMWDASWYREIAERGYPESLPRGADGEVQQNAWAFFPLFPLLARGVMGLTGAPWQVVAPTLALVLGAAAMLVVHQVVAAAALDPRAPEGAGEVGAGAGAWRRRLPLATVVVLTTSAASPVLQVGYTESLALLLLAGALLLVVRRQYLAALPVVLALGLTRAVALPLAVVVAVHIWHRLRAGSAGSRAGSQAFPRAERVQAVLLLVTSGASGLLWPALCAAATGTPDAYTATQAAWRGTGDVVPLAPWYAVASWLFGPVGGVLMLLALAALLVTVLRSRALGRLGPELRAWTAGYLGYLVLVLEPGTSLVRFLLLAFPLAGAVAVPALSSRRPRLALAAVVLVGAVCQVAWVALLWRLVPPSGWPP